MAPINPPTFLQAGTYSARLDRLSQAALLHGDPTTGALAVRGGVRPSPSNAGLLVTQRASPAMFVTVAAGTAYVPTQSAVGGCYVFHNDASYDVAISTAHATLGRKDLIIAKVADAEYSGVSNLATLEVVTGTPAGSPVLPATPAGSVALAQVQVNAAASTITNANITDLRTYTTALGGTIPAPTTARPSNPYRGMAIYDTTAQKPFWYNGTTWLSWSDENFLTTSDLATYLAANGYVTQSYLTSNNYINQAGLDATTWSSYTPIWGASTTNPNLGNGTIQGRYYKIGSFVAVQISMNTGNTTTFGSGTYSWSVPFAPANPASGSFSFAAGSAIYNDAGSGQYQGVACLQDISGLNRIRVVGHNNTEWGNTAPATWANGDDIMINIFYQTS